MPKYNMGKNRNTHFVITQAKKIVTAQGKSPNANIHAFKMQTTNGSVKHLCKSALFALQHTRQTWPVVPTTKKERKRTKPGEQSNFRIFLKQKSWPIRFVQFCLSVTCNYVYVWKHWLPETCVQISTLSKLLKIKINGQKFLKFL